MKAIIIAGGSGTRLRPLTYNTPKPMVPLFDKPFLQYQMEWLRKHGITDVVINLHYLSESISDFFGTGETLGMRINYSLEEKPLGTAGAVKLAEPHFDDEPVIVINGDILTDIDLSALVDFHKTQKAKATLSMIRVADPTAFGLIFTDEKGRITRFVEKPSWDEATVDTVNAGIYVLEPSVFRYVPQNEAYSFERGLFPLLLQLGEPVFGLVTGGYWLDIGSPQKLHLAHTDVLMGRIALNLPAERRADGVWVGKNVEIDPSAEVRGPAYLGDGVKIRKRARVLELSVLSAGVCVDDKVFLERALVGSDSVINEEAQLKGAIVGKRCNIGPASMLGGGAVLADDSTLGRGSVVS